MNKTKSCKGVGLILLVMTFSMIALYSLITPMLQSYDRKEKDGYFLSTIRYLAESGISKVMANLKMNKALPEKISEPLGSGFFEVKASKEGERYSIISCGYMKNREDVKAYIEVVVVKQDQKWLISQWSERIKHEYKTK